MTLYTAYLWSDEGHDYSITAHDFPGFATSAKTMDEVGQMAARGLAFHMQSMIKNGEDIPHPCSLEDAKKALEEDPYSAAATIILIDLPITREKTIRCNVTLPESLVRLIDDEATARSTTRSGFLKDAALRELEIAQDMGIHTPVPGT